MAEFVKLVVFAPETHADVVRKALGDAGAGLIGDYSHCSFSTKGFGRYIPLEGAHPAIGAVGKFEEVVEEKIECMCERAKAKVVIEAVRKVHPYEEVPFDIFVLVDEDSL